LVRRLDSTQGPLYPPPEENTPEWQDPAGAVERAREQIDLIAAPPHFLGPMAHNSRGLGTIRASDGHRIDLAEAW